jgi:hypothetical protein
MEPVAFSIQSWNGTDPDKVRYVVTIMRGVDNFDQYACARFITERDCVSDWPTVQARLIEKYRAFIGAVYMTPPIEINGRQFVYGFRVNLNGKQLHDWKNDEGATMLGVKDVHWTEKIIWINSPNEERYDECVCIEQALHGLE